ncbi:uncharacterized protein LOC132165161 [Corylus avellana]|uniref:uncharacterized protein LOC132165161 n=1 Tax=Corylus avellana TaxID=13451 RepID=UPI00286ACA8B|nr:uncharacterized protein LOC132165161 [Corylus avellana]
MHYETLMTEENKVLYLWTPAPARVVEAAPPRVPPAEVPRRSIAEPTELPRRKAIRVKEPSKGKGKRKAEEAFSKKPSARPPIVARVSLAIVDKPEDPNIPSLEKKKMKKKKKTEGNSQAAQPVVDLEAKENEAHPVLDVTGLVPGAILEKERARVISDSRAHEKTTPEVEALAPHVRAYTEVLNGVREFLGKQDTSARDVLLANRPPRSSSHTPVRAGPSSSEALEVEPLSAVLLSSTPTEVVHPSASNSEEEEPVDVGQILKDLASNMPIVEPLAVIFPRQTEAKSSSLHPEVASTEPVVAEFTGSGPKVKEPVTTEPSATEPTNDVPIITEPMATEHIVVEEGAGVCEDIEQLDADPTTTANEAEGESANLGGSSQLPRDSPSNEPAQTPTETLRPASPSVDRTPDPITWSFGEPLTRLGDN